MGLSRVQAVLLDIDSTLVDSGVAVGRALRTWASEYRVDLGSAPATHGIRVA